jgi:hypothetical protein
MSRIPYKGIRPRNIGQNSLPININVNGNGNVPPIESVPKDLEPPSEPLGKTSLEEVIRREEKIECPRNDDDDVLFEKIARKLKEASEKTSVNQEQQSQLEVKTNPTNFRDVHTFDRQIETKLEVPTRTVEFKIKVFELLQQYVSPPARNMLEVFKGMSNYDSVNNYDAGDLLIYFLDKASGDWLYFLDEQLSDNFHLGQCVQGRTIRLLSIVNAFC